MRYILGRDALRQPFKSEDLIEYDTLVDCGEVKFEFIDEQGKVLDDFIFGIDEKDVSPNFVVKQ